MEKKVNNLNDDDIVNWGKKALKEEAEALIKAADKIGDEFAVIVKKIFFCEGKIVTSGLGKSGHIARKIASTLASTGTSAVFLHPTEALHGDFGILQSADILLAVAFGGETQEIVDVAKYARRIGVPVISITGNLTSTLANLSSHVLDGHVEREICPLNLAPTSSSTLALALGDALAIALMWTRGFSEKDFASLHPGGVIGKKLSLVRDHMYPSEKFSKVDEASDFHSVLEAVTTNNVGLVPVISKQGQFVGSISDGDLRRALLKHGGEALKMHARDLMTRNPKCIEATALFIDAIRLMELNGITRLFVISTMEEKVPIGIIRSQDLLSAKIV